MRIKVESSQTQQLDLELESTSLLEGLKLDSVESINTLLKQIFSEIDDSQSLSPVPLPAEAIPQLDEKEIVENEDNLKNLMDAQNPYFKKTNKEVWFDKMHHFLKKYESRAASDEDGVEFLFKNIGFKLFIFSFARRGVDYLDVALKFLVAAVLRNDALSKYVLSSLLRIRREHDSDMVKTLMHKAIQKIVCPLNAHGIKVEEKEITALHQMAEILENSDLKKALLNLGSGLQNFSLQGLLVIALKENSILGAAMAKFMIDNLVKTKTAQAEVIMLTAALMTGPKSLRRALAKITNINAKDKEGNTAVMRFLKQDHSQVDWYGLMAFCNLLDKGADVSIRNNNGDTALIIAASSLASKHMYHLLENEEVDIEAKNAKGQTALLAAVTTYIKSPKTGLDFIDFKSILNLLNAKHVNFDAKDSNGDTALLLAIKANDKYIFDLLLKYDVNPEVSDSNGKTAMQWALEVDNYNKSLPIGVGPGHDYFLKELEKYTLKKKKGKKERNHKKYETCLKNPHGRFFTKKLPDRSFLNMMRFLGPVETHRQIKTSKDFKARMDSAIKSDATVRLNRLVTLLSDLNVSTDRASLPKETDKAFNQLFSVNKQIIAQRMEYLLNELNDINISKEDISLLIKRLSTIDIVIDPITLEEKKKDDKIEPIQSDQKAEPKELADNSQWLKYLERDKFNKKFETLFKKFKDKLKFDNHWRLLASLREEQMAELIKVYSQGANGKEDREFLERILTEKVDNIKIVSALLEAGVNLNLVYEAGHAANIKGFRLLHYAASVGNRKLARVLIGHGANINVRCEMNLTPLHYAIMSSKVELVKLLLENGADINLQDGSGNTPLMFALNQSIKKDDLDKLFANKEIINLLIKKGSKLDIKNHKNETPIACAIRNKNESIKELLQEAKRRGIDAGLNANDVNELTPLIALMLQEFGSKKSRTEKADLKEADLKEGDLKQEDFQDHFPKLYVKVLRPLMKYGINIDAQCKEGTALMFAVYYKELEFAEWILDQGANPLLANAKGLTPLSAAQVSNQPKMLSLLKAYVRPFHFKKGIFTAPAAGELRREHKQDGQTNEAEDQQNASAGEALNPSLSTDQHFI